MKKLFYLLVIVISTYSCNSNSDNSTDDYIVSAPDTISTLTNTTLDNAKAPVSGVTPANTPTTSTTSSAPMAVNPAHGQPGHRCDIAVGAPLNSTPSTPVPGKTATGKTNEVKAAPASNTPTSQNSTGLNPAHGQPGHRCDIAVGAPLNGTPAAKPTSATPVNNSPSATPLSTTPAAQPTVPAYTPTTISTEIKPPNNNNSVSPAQNTAGGVKLNPAHGQPGHDCTIAVGQPLKKQ